MKPRARKAAGLCLALAALAGADPAAALALKPAAATPWVDSLKALALGAGLLALAYAGLRRLRRRQPGAGDTRPGPRVLESRRASQKTLLLVVQWEGRRYLLAETGGTLQVLDRAGDAEPAP